MAEAVAASMAVPVVFALVVLQKFPGNCLNTLEAIIGTQPIPKTGDNNRLRRALYRPIRDFRDPNSGHYIKLIDGGTTDNLGLVSILQSRILLGTPYGPISENDAITVRKLLFIVVDADQGPSGDWTREVAGPSGIDIASAAVDTAINRTMRMSYDSFIPMMKNWRDEISRYRCSLPAERQRLIQSTKPSWRCDDVSFSVTQISFADLGDAEDAQLSMVPTRLKLPVTTIDQLISAGKRAVAADQTISTFAKQ